MGRCGDQSQRDPWLPPKIFAHAVALLLSDRPADAAAAIEEAIERRPNCRAYHLLLAEAQLASGAEGRAKETKVGAMKLPDQPDMLAPRLPLPANHQALLSRLAPAATVSEII